MKKDFVCQEAFDHLKQDMGCGVDDRCKVIIAKRKLE
jgi:hypothetical protein